MLKMSEHVLSEDQIDAHICPYCGCENPRECDSVWEGSTLYKNIRWECGHTQLKRMPFDGSGDDRYGSDVLNIDKKIEEADEGSPKR